MKRVYYTYKITIKNKESSFNNCVYVGKHITKNINDNYYGSGVLIKKYISKWGHYGLRKKILSFYKNENQLDKAEIDLVNKTKLKFKEKCLNLNDGGVGSFTYINEVINNDPSIRHKHAVAGGEGNKARLKDKHNLEKWKEQCSEVHKNRSKKQKKEIYNKVSNSLKIYYLTPAGKQEKYQRDIKNRQSNIISSKKWREEFFNYFKCCPEFFRKYNKMQEAINLYKSFTGIEKDYNDAIIFKEYCINNIEKSHKSLKDETKIKLKELQQNKRINKCIYTFKIDNEKFLCERDLQNYIFSKYNINISNHVIKKFIKDENLKVNKNIQNILNKIKKELK